MMEEDEDDEILQVTTVVEGGRRREPVDPSGVNGREDSAAAAAGGELVEVDLVRDVDVLLNLDTAVDTTETIAVVAVMDDAMDPPPPVLTSVSAEDDVVVVDNGDVDDDAPLLPPEVMDQKVRQMEVERGQLTAEILEKDQVLGNLECEVASLKAALAQREEEHSLAAEEADNRYKRLQEETTAKIEELKKQFSTANRDKEAMVMKYALGEKEVILQRKGKEEAEKKLKTLVKEKEELQAKVKTLTTEKVKAQQLADSRMQDIQVAKKDVERWKEEVKMQEAKACAAASKQKGEVESHRETRDQLDKTIKHLGETRQEIEVTRKECAEFMQKIRDDDEQKRRKTKTTEIEQKASLIIDAAAASELDSLREKYKKMIDENNGLSQKIQKMERERLESSETIGRLKSAAASQKQEVSDLMAQVAEMESLRMQLQRSEERCEARATEVERLRAEAVEINADMAACRAKEAELLEFTQKLTDKNVTLQSDLAVAEARSAALESEHSRLAGSVGELQTNGSQTRIELEEERKRRRSETEMLAKKLAEKVKQVETLSQQTLDAENEVRVLKRKNAASLRELTRELQSCKRRLDERESSPLGGIRGSNGGLLGSGLSLGLLSHSSRTSSNTSLNRLEEQQQQQHQQSSSSSAAANHRDSNGLVSTTSYRVGERTHQVMVPDSQVLVEKIVALQRSIAKKQEKLDFLEEHISTLLEEVKKKNKIIQHYVMTMETGALATAESDVIKPAVTRKVHLEKERKMSESGGIMASLYTSKPSDASMSLELSLEINQKLQAVLEDTLLKNITLKENINTLGNEIAKISGSKNSR